MAKVSDSGKSNPGDKSSLKVYGWRGYRVGLVEQSANGSFQTREGMAAKSVAEVLRATGMGRHAFNEDGCETANAEELALALAEPGVIFVQHAHCPA